MDGRKHYKLLQTLPYRAYDPGRSRLNLSCGNLSALISSQKSLMTRLLHIIAFTLSVLCMGVVFARPVYVQQRVAVQEVYVPVVQPQRVRRFSMPPNVGTYQRGIAQPYPVAPDAPSRATRMTVEERRALRRQINEVNQDIYHQKRR